MMRLIDYNPLLCEGSNIHGVSIGPPTGVSIPCAVEVLSNLKDELFPIKPSSFALRYSSFYRVAHSWDLSSR